MALRPRMAVPPLHEWNIELIRQAIDDQLIGRFERPVQLATAMRRDDALFAALVNRIAPSRSLATRLDPSPHDRTGDALCEAKALFERIDQRVISDAHESLANHGIAVMYIDREVSSDGTRVALRPHTWPLAHVRWDPYKQVLWTLTFHGDRVYIHHGDGNWIVCAKHELTPWRVDACVIPGGLLFGIHAYAMRDWATASASHGNAKPIGTLPDGVDLQVRSEEGHVAISPEAAAFEDLLSNLAAHSTPYGIKPFGSTIDYLSNPSTQYQIWSELLRHIDASAARIYLGTDGTLGAKAGAPGADVQALFGVAQTIVEGDLGAIEHAIQTGLIDVWAEQNFGSKEVAPRWRYEIPDPDLQEVREQYSARNAAFLSAVKQARDAQLQVDQDYVDGLAREYGVAPPRVASSVSFFAYELDSGAVTVDEFRTSKGLPPLAVGGNQSIPAAREAKASLATDASQLPDPPVDPDADGEPGEQATAAARAALAEKMSVNGIARCEHGCLNRCRLCGIERVRDFQIQPDGSPLWVVAWRPL